MESQWLLFEKPIVGSYSMVALGYVQELRSVVVAPEGVVKSARGGLENHTRLLILVQGELIRMRRRSPPRYEMA